MSSGNEKMSWAEFWGGVAILVGAALALSFVVLVVFRIFWVTHVENYELGFVFDSASGKIEMVDKTGWIVRTPIRYTVHHIDLRPHQLTISANQRVLNAKLVRFNPKGLQTFVEWHGRSAGDSTNDLQEILKCYAFDLADGKDCPFLEVVQEIAPNQGGGVSDNVNSVKVGKVEK